MDCFKCGDIEHIQSVCNTTVHLAATNIKSCTSNSIKLSIYNDHLPLSKISKDSNPCEITVSNQSIYHISQVIVQDMVFLNDSLISDEISCKSEENILNEHSHDRKRDEVLIDADFSSDPLLCNYILNKFEETISEESNRHVLSNIICPHNAFVSCGKLVQCEAQVLNELEFDYSSNDFISTAVYPHHEVNSNVYSDQSEKYIVVAVHNQHVDCIQSQEPSETVPISVVNSNTNEHILHNTEFLSNTMSDRHRMNLRRRTIDYRHFDYNLRCGGCGV
ncbi:hypothetical protein MS3_00002239 [Schistosoma haematobium]|uniref:Uncharacterized protein n=1 Tax=Schistosoma haematobium TaxID=6185 RepID=A0A6A5DMN2_SCHHA|nr:hypothetical protein MS3_00002239 [Schistosoma haematobium]KAH9596618.1 hypothetical protein MS3_00002239 [Schistosoma haematobium]